MLLFLRLLAVVVCADVVVCFRLVVAIIVLLFAVTLVIDVGFMSGYLLLVS